LNEFYENQHLNKKPTITYLPKMENINNP